MRLIEIISEGPLLKEFQEYIDTCNSKTRLYQTGKGGVVVVKLMVEDDDVNRILRDMENVKGEAKVFIYDVEGVIGLEEETKDDDDLELARFFTSSKEELRKHIIAPVNLSWNFLIMVFASSLVAGIGILQQNVAIIIGAMVIAPFLGPNMLISFGTTLGDLRLVRKGLYVAAVGTVIAVGISWIWGMTSSQVHFIDRGYAVTYQDVILAIACGVAGALSQLSRQGTTLVGVMVAAALLPPLISAGLYLGGGYYEEAWHKVILFVTNIVCLILSGIVVFYSAGIRPSAWWEREEAVRKTRFALLILIVILLFLVGIIYNLNLR
jgi:uncharacterized hydrophobic protein (TIGR00341 family)